MSVAVKWHLEALRIFPRPCYRGINESGKCKCKLSESMYEIMRVFTVPLTFSKEEFVASSHEDGQNVLQFQTEDIRR